MSTVPDPAAVFDDPRPLEGPLTDDVRREVEAELGFSLCGEFGTAFWVAEWATPTSLTR